jgi:hypothetical protein
LRRALNDCFTSSNAPLSGVSILSHGQNRGELHATDKIRPHHLERKALLYVRQSSAHQVLHNRESSALQYAMRDRLTALGWSEIEVIDDDLGRSAAGGVPRAGFERMVARLNRIQATSTRGVRACIRRVAGCATPTGSAGHAGATANLKLTFHPDHSAGADH